MKRKILLATLIAFLLVLTTSCTNSMTVANDVRASELIFPKSDYYYALINVDGEIRVVTHAEGSGNLSAYAKEGGQELNPFTLPDDPSCYRTRYDAYETLPDGQLQVWKRCESGGNGTLIYLMSYDWVYQLQQLSGPLPLGSSAASWNPNQTKAIGYLDSKFSSQTLYWIWKSGFAPLDLVIGNGSHSWNLQDDFPDFQTADSGKSGTTGRAAWSPDGKQIAFFASPDAIGKTGFSRFDVKYSLYLMDPATLNPILVEENIYSPFVLAWSSDSRHIAFIGKYGFWKEYGIWVYSLDTDTITQVSLGTYQSIVWRPGENILVAIECDENYDSCNKIMEYDLTSVLDVGK